MSKLNITENITQVLLIIIGVLIAFSVDRCYDGYKENNNKTQFVKEQVVVLESEAKSLVFYNDYNQKMINHIDIALRENQHLDTIIKYTKKLPNLTDFAPEFNNLAALRDVYKVDKFLNIQERRLFKQLYKRYSNIEFYEKNYNTIIHDKYNVFWGKFHNNYNNSFVDKTQFKSNEYLNLIHACKTELENKNKFYLQAKQEIELLIKKLKSI